MISAAAGRELASMFQSLYLISRSPHLVFPSLSSGPKPSLSTNPPRRIPPHSSSPSSGVLSVRASTSDSPIPDVLVSDNGTGSARAAVAASGAASLAAIEVDAVTEAELKENGFRSTRRTKLVCTIGPTTCASEQLEALAVVGMNVARINMCHGTGEWHKRVIDRVRKLNEEKGYAIAIMMDTEWSEIHMGDLGGASSAKAEVKLILSTHNNHTPPNPRNTLTYGF